MSGTARIETISRDDWQAQAPRYRDYSYRQVWEFGVACAERVGAQSEHVAIIAQGEQVGLVDVRIKHIPLTGTGIAYVNGGPLTRKGKGCTEDSRRLHDAIRALRAHYCDDRHLTLRIGLPPGDPDVDEDRRKLLAGAGFRESEDARKYRTFMVDLRDDLVTVRKALQQKWRNCLNRAEKNGLAVRVGQSLELFDEFGRLFDEMIARKGFTVDLGPAFYRAIQTRLAPPHAFEVMIASLNGQPCAGYVGSFLGGVGVYLLGASNELGMQQKASYLLQWRAIEQCKEAGCKWYDLGGIDPEGNPGVHKFKAGLGGRDVTVPGPFERQPDPVRGALVRMGEKAVRALRAVRR